MAAFSYRAINPAGKLVKGTLEGDSERQVRGQLRNRQLKPISVVSVREKQRQSTEWRLFTPRLQTRDLTLFTRQMSSLVQSGMPLADALQGVARQSRKPLVQSMVLQIRSRVLEGLSFAQALAEHPRSFNAMYRAMVNAGEQAGFLGPVLERLADYNETSQQTRQKLTSAMIYPSILMLVCIGIVIALMVLVVPQLISVFERARVDLPPLTRGLIAFSAFIRDFGLYCLVIIVLAVIAFKRWLGASKNLRKWHEILLKPPLTGRIITEADTARFATTVSMLLDSGVPLLQALRISSQTMNNLILRERAEQVANTVQEGSGLSRAMDQAQVFPPLLVQMAASGEMNGTLAEQLRYAARNQERELDMLLSTTMSILEPLTIIIMSVVVGIIMYALLKPIFQLSNLI